MKGEMVMRKSILASILCLWLMLTFCMGYATNFAQPAIPEMPKMEIPSFPKQNPDFKMPEMPSKLGSTLPELPSLQGAEQAPAFGQGLNQNEHQLGDFLKGPEVPEGKFEHSMLRDFLEKGSPSSGQKNWDNEFAAFKQKKENGDPLFGFNMDEQSAFKTNYKFGNLEDMMKTRFTSFADIKSSINQYQYTGSLQSLFDSKYGDKLDLKPIEKVGMPDGFTAEELLKSINSKRENTFDQYLNSDQYKSISSLIGMSTAFERAHTVMEAPKRTGIGTKPAVAESPSDYFKRINLSDFVDESNLADARAKYSAQGGRLKGKTSLTPLPSYQLPKYESAGQKIVNTVTGTVKSAVDSVSSLLNIGKYKQGR